MRYCRLCGDPNTHIQYPTSSSDISDIRYQIYNCFLGTYLYNCFLWYPIVSLERDQPGLIHMLPLSDFSFLACDTKHMSGIEDDSLPIAFGVFFHNDDDISKGFSYLNFKLTSVWVISIQANPYQLQVPLSAWLFTVCSWQESV